MGTMVEQLDLSIGGQTTKNITIIPATSIRNVLLMICTARVIYAQNEASG
jgi:hypothetical protein